jgi:single-stranded DNA-binding protein
VNDPIVTLVGFVSRPPAVKETAKGPLTTFGLGVRQTYAQDATPRWYSIDVWNEGLQAWCKKELIKGTKVAVEGFERTNTRDGVTYHDISAQMLGLVEFAQRSKRNETAAPAAEKAISAAAAAASNGESADW